MSKLTISDIARLAQVSKTTVSRILNERPDVNGGTAERVRRIVEESGYVKNSRAVQLSKGRSNTIGLLAPRDFGLSPWFTEVLGGAMDQVRGTEYALTILPFPAHGDSSDRLVEQMRGGAMDALLVCSVEQPLDVIARVPTAGFPMLCINDYGFNQGLPTIAPDEAQGVCEAVNHLIGVGRQRFAMLVGPENYPVSALRLAAYRDALGTHGLNLDDSQIIRSDFTVGGARDATARLLARGVRFDALLASSDAMAVGAMRALKHAAIRIPTDVSVVGFDDFPTAELTEPRLSTVRYPVHDMSERAVKRLIEAVKKNCAPEGLNEVFSTRLVVRDSSDPSIGGRKTEGR